ncbi:MAG: nucleoside recognition protein [Bacteroidales bacterium]|nr:nucleoside recognition protein [Bacteroidales bacterium]
MNPSFLQRFSKSVKLALPKGIRTSWWLLKITIPVSFAVLLMNYFGLLNLMAKVTGPFFHYLGLPGSAAIVLITSVFTNIYSVVAVLTTLNLPVREGIIIGTMCLVSHGFLIETAVLKKTGSSVVRMLTLRLTGSLLIGLFLNFLLPVSQIVSSENTVSQEAVFSEVLIKWLQTISITTIKIIVLVNLLLILQRLMEEFGLMKWLEKPLQPLMKLFGLPLPTAFSWIVANAIGLAYGSAIMIDQVEEKKMSKQDADLLNHHIAVSHSQLEDPLLFLALGYTIHWMIWPRVLIAMLAVWIRRLELKLRTPKITEKSVIS